MTILELKQYITGYLGSGTQAKTPSDLVINGLDYGLITLNEVRRSAEMLNDFGFQRKLLTLDVDPVNGADLADAVIQGTTTTVDIKTIVEMGIFDTNGNFRPIEWTTTEESQERQRQENPFEYVRYPTDAQAECWPAGQRRLILRDNKVFVWPHTSQSQLNQVVSIGIEVYCFSDDWVVGSNTQVLSGSMAQDGTYYTFGSYNNYPLYLNVNPVAGTGAGFAIWFNGTIWLITATTNIGTSPTDRYALTSTSQNPAGGYTGQGTFTGFPTLTSVDTDTTSDIWTTKGSEYLIWASIVKLNHRFKFFVPRTEGNLPSPEAMAANALSTFIDWDVSRFETFRRHGR